jgi:hypothetical protein
MRGETVDPENFNTSRGELDCERQPTKPAADLDDKRGIGIGERELVDDRKDPLEEKLHRWETTAHRPR